MATCLTRADSMKKRKQSLRSKRQESRGEGGRGKRRRSREGRVSTPVPSEAPDPKGGPVQEAAASSEQGSGQTRESSRASGSEFGQLIAKVFLAAVVTVFVGLIGMLIKTWWVTDDWPVSTEVGLTPLSGILGAGLLVATSAFAWIASWAAAGGRFSGARAALLVTLLVAGTMLGLRAVTYGDLYDRGLWQRSVVGPLYERAGIYYLHAVKQRLKDLFDTLEERRVETPNEFSDEDQERLDLVMRLQSDMVSWTEHQVGHWLDELDQRRAVIHLLAYQIYPRMAEQDQMQRYVQGKQRELERQRQWFALLEDYCEAKVDFIKPQTSAAKASGAGEESGGKVDESEDAPRTVEELEEQLASDLKRLGLSNWAYAESIRKDTSDPALAYERLNQVRARKQSLDSRLVFLEEYVEPAVEDPAGGGLNVRESWLRLPVYLPAGTDWAGSFFPLTGLHSVLTVFVMVISFVPLFSRRGPSAAARWRSVMWWWHTTAATGIALFLLFYVVF